MTTSRPNFTGLWQANLEKSRIAAPAPARLLMKIAHDDDQLRQAVLITRPSGEEARQVLTYSMAGADSVTELRGAPLTIRVRWLDTEMVIESAYAGTLFRDYWSLSDCGRTLTMKHRDDALAGQVTVLERVDAERVSSQR